MKVGKTLLNGFKLNKFMVKKDIAKHLFETVVNMWNSLLQSVVKSGTLDSSMTNLDSHKEIIRWVNMGAASYPPCCLLQIHDIFMLIIYIVNLAFNL